MQDKSTLAMWKERGSRVALIIASQLMEMKVGSLIVFWGIDDSG